MGGSSGGSSSGRVDYPTYMKTQHETWLDDISGIITTVRAGGSPFAAATAYDPDTVLAENATALALFDALVIALDPAGSWQTNYDTIDGKMTDLDTLTINVSDQVSAHGAIVDADIEANVLPVFKRGMQDVSASMTSAFMIGEAMILSARDRDLAKYQAGLEQQNTDLTIRQNQLVMEREKILSQNIATVLNQINQEAEFYKSLVHYTTEVNRIKIVALKEEIEANIEYDAKDTTWDLSLFAEGGNMMAAIAGAATQQGVRGASKGQTAIGGALSGAAAGMMVSGGNPAVAGLGAVVGGLGGLL